jgi:hypothetical protein
MRQVDDLREEDSERADINPAISSRGGQRHGSCVNMVDYDKHWRAWLSAGVSGVMESPGRTFPVCGQFEVDAGSGREGGWARGTGGGGGDGGGAMSNAA